MLVAPYYGAEISERRAGWDSELVARIRCCEYPQYVWEQLPIAGAEESILRLDHIQPLGRHHDSIERTKFHLGQDGMTVIEEWITWLMTGMLPEDGVLYGMRGDLQELSTS
jgi:hypothetical protein